MIYVLGVSNIAAFIFKDHFLGVPQIHLARLTHFPLSPPMPFETRLFVTPLCYGPDLPEKGRPGLLPLGLGSFFLI